MYKCDKCGLISSVGEKETKKIVETRNRIYWNIILLDLLTKEKKYLQYLQKDLSILEELNKRGVEENFKVIKDYITKGIEIKKEITVCNNCITRR
jgi:hypothetical protein